MIQAVRRNRLALREQKAELHFRIGRLQAARGRDSEALDAYREAMRSDPQQKGKEDLTKRYQDAVQFWEALQKDRGERPTSPEPAKTSEKDETPPKVDR